MRPLTPPTSLDVPIEYLPSAFGNWLAGFIDGEGCFLICQRREDSFHCRFTLSLRDDDWAIIKEIQERTHLGTYRRYHAPSMKAVGKPGRVTWSIQNKMDCGHLVKLLEANPLRAKKARDYFIWSEAVWEWCKLHPDPERMREFKRQLHAVRDFVPEMEGNSIIPVACRLDGETPDPTLFDEEEAA